LKRDDTKTRGRWKKNQEFEGNSWKNSSIRKLGNLALETLAKGHLYATQKQPKKSFARDLVHVPRAIVHGCAATKEIRARAMPQ